MMKKLNYDKNRPRGDKSLVIVHCVRSTVGGIFRHIADLIRHQSENGHQVGLICDSLTGGQFEADKLEALKPYMALGFAELPMSRSVSLSDITMTKTVFNLLKDVDVDVVHCHGAKGGAYGRLAAYFLSKQRQREGGSKVVSVYSPHGGSLHYSPKSPQGRVYFALERFLEHFTSEFVFVAGFEVAAFTRKIGQLRRPWSIAYNGLTQPEFEPIRHDADCVDFIYAGHMRDLKGSDLFIDAVQIASARLGRPVTAEMIGDGEDLERYKAEVSRRGLEKAISFRDPMPIREAFARGRNLVVPSRAEAMPYIVLEAIGAGLPTLVTSVGGVPEIYGSHSHHLIPPGDANMIATSMIVNLQHPKDAQKLANTLRDQILEQFTVQRMYETVDAVYARHLTGSPVAVGLQNEVADLKLAS
ncbi:MAG: glycosyltransferase [Hyphomicrobiales bacterium]